MIDINLHGHATAGVTAGVTSGVTAHTTTGVTARITYLTAEFSVSHIKLRQTVAGRESHVL